jgi:hypothetical protein
VPSLIGRTAATDAVRVPSGGRNQIGRPLAVRHGRPPLMWRTAVVARRCKIFKRRPSICFSTSYPLWHASRNLLLNSRVNVLISGAQRAINASLENVLNINTSHWSIPDALGNALQDILPSPIFPHLFVTLVALDSWGRMILKIRDPRPRRLH